MDQYIIDNLRDWKPFSPETGLAGPNPRLEPLRQIYGTVGGLGSEQVVRSTFVEDPVISGGDQGSGASGTGTTFTVIVNGTRMSYNFLGNFV